MPDDSKVMRWGLLLAAVIIVVRIVLEQAGVPDSVNNIFGVAWLYILLPILFALGIRARNAANPYKSLLKDVFVFALCTRVMVMITYMLAYAFQWKPRRFAYPGGSVGENVSAWTGLLFIPLRNALSWVVTATVLGMIVGSITLLFKRVRASIDLSCIAAVAVTSVLTVTLPIKAVASTGTIPLNCDRACLENLVEQYLAAVVAHDPGRLPLSKDVVYTENNQVMQIGDGFWKTAQGRGKYTHIFADPEFGQVAYMGTMREAGEPLLMSLRLRVELGRITEIESIYFKPGGGGPNNIAEMDKPYKPEEIWFKSIPTSQRMSRQELIAVADAYFTGLQKNDGKGVNGTGTYPFTADCHRIENGSPTTNVPRAPGLPKDAIDLFSMDCLSQFRLGIYFVVQNIHGRRYPVVDRERGVVWAHAVFDQGTVSKGVLSDGRPYEFKFFNRPSSILVTEAFLIENGKIRRVEMIGPSVAYHLNSPWPGGLGGD